MGKGLTYSVAGDGWEIVLKMYLVVISFTINEALDTSELLGFSKENTGLFGKCQFICENEYKSLIVLI